MSTTPIAFPCPQVLGPKRLKSLEAAKARVMHRSDAIPSGNSDALQSGNASSEDIQLQQEGL